MENNQSESPKQWVILEKINKHPIIMLVVSVTGILGTISGFYFYFASITKPELSYYISSARTPIVQKGNLNDFSVTYQGTQITNDLSSVQVQIWNKGKAPIRREDILSPITIKTKNSEPIYQVTFSSTRDVIGFNMEDSQTEKNGLIQCDWKILEQNDGIKVQIIYGGNVHLPIDVSGTIVGQKNIVKFEQATANNYLLLILYIVRASAIGISIALICAITKLILLKRFGRKIGGITSYALTIYILITLIYMAHYFSHHPWTTVGPPFGF